MSARVIAPGWRCEVDHAFDEQNKTIYDEDLSEMPKYVQGLLSSFKQHVMHCVLKL